MANIPIRDIPGSVIATPDPSNLIPMDNGSIMQKTTIGNAVNAALPLSSQAEAQAGVDNAKRMSPLRTKQAIDAQVPTIVSAAITALNLGTMSQEDASDYTPTVELADVALSNSYTDLSDLPTLGTAAATDASDYATAAQGALADTAIQPGEPALVPAGGLTGEVLAKTSGTDYATEWVAGGAGDMLSSVYDPGNVAANAFSSANQSYDNTASGLTATNVKSAIDELAGREVAITTFTFASKAAAQAYVPNVETLADLSDFIRLEGYYAAGDGGGALYRKVSTEPTHAGKFSINVPDVGEQWYEYADRTVNVLALGASHTLDDNAPFFNDAIQIAQDFRKGGVVYFPAPPAGQVYQVKDSMNVTKRCTLRGEDIDVQIYAVEFAQSVAIVNVVQDFVGAFEFVTIEKLTLRDDGDNTVGGVASGVYFKNCAHILMRDVRLFSVYDGIYLEASGAAPRSFSNRFENVIIFPQAKRHGVHVTSFNGGGQHKFDGCTFGADDTGFVIQPNSGMAGLVFDNCNFEQCANAFRAYGTLEGVSFDGCYSEKNGSSYTFAFFPTSGNLQAGISIKGCFFETDAEVYPIIMGADGNVAGFNITANRARDYSTAFVRYNSGNVAGGEIVANQIGTTTSVTSNGPATGVRIANNFNNSGAVS